MLDQLLLQAELHPNVGALLKRARRHLLRLPRKDWPGSQPHNCLMLFPEPGALQALALLNCWPLPEPLCRWLFREPAPARWLARRRRLRRQLRFLHDFQTLALPLLSHLLKEMPHGETVAETEESPQPSPAGMADPTAQPGNAKAATPAPPGGGPGLC